MTEDEWLAGSDPARMLVWLDQQLYFDGRRRGLFVCAACRLAWPHLQPPVQRLLEAAEDIAELGATERRVGPAVSRFHDVLLALQHEALSELEEEVRALSCWTFHGVGQASAVAVAVRALCPPATPATLADQLRELFGNPFRKPRRVSAALHARLAARPVERRSRDLLLVREWQAWEGGTVVQLARAIHDRRAFDHLPYLADALEEAGCADPALLDHARRPGGHVRGCWLLDLLLDRA